MEPQKSKTKIIQVYNKTCMMISYVSRPRDDTSVKELVPRVWQPGEAPVDTICVSLGVSLLLRR